MLHFKGWLTENFKNKLRYLGSNLTAGDYAFRTQSFHDWHKWMNQPIGIPSQYKNHPLNFLDENTSGRHRNLDSWKKIIEAQINLWTQIGDQEQIGLWGQALSVLNTSISSPSIDKKSSTGEDWFYRQEKLRQQSY